MFLLLSPSPCVIPHPGFPPLPTLLFFCRRDYFFTFPLPQLESMSACRVGGGGEGSGGEGSGGEEKVGNEKMSRKDDMGNLSSLAANTLSHLLAEVRCPTFAQRSSIYVLPKWKVSAFE